MTIDFDEVIPIWHVLTLDQTDLILWMKIIAIVVFLKCRRDTAPISIIYSKPAKWRSLNKNPLCMLAKLAKSELFRKLFSNQCWKGYNEPNLFQ